jgi:hypothetical protein
MLGAYCHIPEFLLLWCYVCLFLFVLIPCLVFILLWDSSELVSDYNCHLQYYARRTTSCLTKKQCNTVIFSQAGCGPRCTWLGWKACGPWFDVVHMIKFYCLHHPHSILGDIQDAVFIVISVCLRSACCAAYSEAPFYTSVGTSVDWM